MNLHGSLELTDVLTIEQLALRAWPGLECEDHKGWLLRYSQGVTRRANSVWPNAMHGEDDLGDRIAEVARCYHARDLPARYQICPAALPVGLDNRLEQLGYRAAAKTAVQTTNLDSLAESLGSLGNGPGMNVNLTAHPTDVWWTCYAQADEVPPQSILVRRAICEQIREDSAYATAIIDGEVAAVGSAVVEAGWIGFFNIATLITHRRKGAARALIAALVDWGNSMGATRAYLQVVAENQAALALYSRLGFTTAYFYHYREEMRS